MYFTFDTTHPPKLLVEILKSYARQHSYSFRAIDQTCFILSGGAALSLNPNCYAHVILVRLESDRIHARLGRPRTILPEPAVHCKRLPSLQQQLQHLKEYLTVFTESSQKSNATQIENQSSLPVSLIPESRSNLTCPLCGRRPLRKGPYRDIYSLSSLAGSLTLSVVLGVLAGIFMMTLYGFMLIQFSPIELPEFFGVKYLRELDFSTKLLSATFVGMISGSFAGLLVSLLLLLSELIRFVGGMTLPLLMAVAVWLLICTFIPAVWPASLICGFLLPFAVYYAYSSVWRWR